MNAIELFHKDGTPAHAFACGICGTVQASCARQSEHSHLDRDCAERCCTCRVCGKQTALYQSAHPECWEKERVANNKNLLETAAKLETWDGWVCFDDADGDGFFPSIKALCEWLDNQGAEFPRPEFVFVCEPSHFHLDLEMILEDELESHHETVKEGLSGYDDLRRAVDAFNALNQNLCTYYPDNARAVRVPVRPIQETAP